MCILILFSYLKYKYQYIYWSIYLFLPFTIYLYIPNNIDILPSTRLYYLIFMYNCLFLIHNLFDQKKMTIVTINIVFLILNSYFLFRMIYGNGIISYVLYLNELNFFIKMIFFGFPFFSFLYYFVIKRRCSNITKNVENSGGKD